MNAFCALQQAHALRAAINTPIQGSAADVATAAMLSIDACQELKELALEDASSGGIGQLMKFCCAMQRFSPRFLKSFYLASHMYDWPQALGRVRALGMLLQGKASADTL